MKGAEVVDYLTLKSLSGRERVPVVMVKLESPLFVGEARMGVVNQLPIEGVDVVLGNDLLGSRMSPIQVEPEKYELKKVEGVVSDLGANAAVTRAMSSRLKVGSNQVREEAQVEKVDLRTRCQEARGYRGFQ